MGTVSDEAFRELDAAYGPGKSLDDMLALWYADLGYQPGGDLYGFFGGLGAVGATVNDRTDDFWRNVGLATAFIPTDIAGCALWLDADDNAAFTFSSGVLISQINDKSGQNRHFGQATVTNQPTRQANVVNGRAVIRFDGIDNALDTTVNDWADSFTAGELFAVLAIVAETGEGGIHAGWSPDINADHYPFSDGNVYEPWGTTARKSTGNPSVGLTTWHLYNIRTASGSYSTHVNGTQHYTTATNTVGFNGGVNQYRIGSNITPTFRSFDVAEWVVYNNVISAGDRTALHNYVETKYAITVA